MRGPAGLKGIVNNSQWCADLQSKSPQSRRHALAEAQFDAFPTPAVHLGGATYNINMIVQLLWGAMRAGVVNAPFMDPNDKLPLISGTDVAAAADAVLKDFSTYSGQVRSLSKACTLTVLIKTACDVLSGPWLHNAGMLTALLLLQAVRKL